MKRFLITGILALAACIACAMDYEEARQRAWFLTDKMAYELNLTPEQCDRAYEVNLDYLMSIRTASDCDGAYWHYRNADLRCILFDWQYALYETVDYFFHPIRWLFKRWYFPVFERYRRGYYFFSRPAIYITYQGRPWRHRSRRAPSPYRHMYFRPGNGMRDRYEHGRRPGMPVHGVPPSHRPGIRPPGQRPGLRPGQRPDNRPGQRPDNRPGQRPGDRPGQRPGRANGQRPERRPSQRQRPSQRPRQQSSTRSFRNNSGHSQAGRPTFNNR